MTSSLRTSLRDRLTTARRARDRQTAGVLGTVLAALDNAEAVPASSSDGAATTSAHVAGAAAGLGSGDVPRRLLSAEDERALVSREITELRSSSSVLAAAGQQKRAAELTWAAELLDEVLRG